MFILAPTIGWSWPAVTPIITAAAAALGYNKLTESNSTLLRGTLTKQMENIRRVVVPLDSVLAEVISEDLGAEERVMFEKDDFILVFRKDSRGKFFVEVSGPREQTALNLELRGEEFAKEVVRKYAYHKMVEQIENRGATVIEEEVKENGDIVLKSRQWR